MNNHPCFNIDSKDKYARVHLPVAPTCNVQCNYCDRRYDCCNESRPGVSSMLLSPDQALYFLKALSEKMPNISVIGIAGPGDPFASPEITMRTVRLVKKEFPEKIMCLSTNGLDLFPYIDELVEIGLSHLTITINSVKSETLAKLYRWVRYNKRVYRGEAGGDILLEQQLRCLQRTKERCIVVKINTVICPGINDSEVEEIAQKVADLGADTMNCIPLYPVENTEFAFLPIPSEETMGEIKSVVAQHIRPMKHCTRCRADAVGLLGSDNTEMINFIGQISAFSQSINQARKRHRVAVASNEGLLVNLHLGEARKVYIFEQSKNGYHFVEMRSTPPEGGGMERWRELADKTLVDCQAILVAGIGENPMKMMREKGIRVIQMNGLIDAGLDAIYLNLPLKTICRSQYAKCGERCKGSGNGCG
ncbi:MAG: nitrogenase cofactor biosynthesis protein NifB [Candidatus Azobacteroides pseudotrichonymphae]|jgi:nitrogen fixation protein NifB|nr:radical SAM protein [Bacteroidales bacterium OttesenSCG-928-I14]GMO35529.1 MAG: nitrogenase cofactor biosynthesis protein NifB [Candidatus Azobacteroides pseudotrichonymphae]